MNPEELKHIAVLQAVDHAALARFANVLGQKEYADGQTVFKEGDPGNSMYFIAQGSIRIQRRAQTTGGLDKTIALLESGDFFGAMSLFEQKPRAASAVAAGNVKVLELSKAAFDDILSQSSVSALSVLFAMIHTSSERIRWLSSQVIVYDEVGKAIGEARDLQTLLDLILQQLVWATGADWGLLVLRSQFAGRLEVRAQVNLALNQPQLEAVSNGQGFFGPILRQPENLLVANMDNEEPFKSHPRLGFESPSLLLSPINVDGALLGLIVLGGHRADQFDLNHLNLTGGVARQAAQAILNARHREEQEAKSRHFRQFVRF